MRIRDLRTLVGQMSSGTTIPSAVASDVELATALADKQSIDEKGQSNGYASLDGDGKVPETELSVESIGGVDVTRYVEADGSDAISGLTDALGAARNRGVPLVFPADSGGGFWGLAESLVVQGGDHIIGFGKNTHLKNLAGANQPVITNLNQSSGDIGIVLEGLRCDGNRAEQTGQFSTIKLVKSFRGRFVDLWCFGAKRTQAFPNGNGGEGFELLDGQYNRISQYIGRDNDYDGLKLRRSTQNLLSDILGIDNGRCALQLAFPFGGTEGLESEGSNYNTVRGVQAYHATGTPGTVAPTTHAVYLHTACFNDIAGVVAYGVRSAVGLISGSTDNTIGMGVARLRFNAHGAVETEHSPTGGACQRNHFHGARVRWLSGANPIHALIASGAYNRVANMQAGLAQATGTAVVRVENTASDTRFSDCVFGGMPGGSLTEGTPGNAVQHDVAFVA